MTGRRWWLVAGLILFAVWRYARRMARAPHPPDPERWREGLSDADVAELPAADVLALRQAAELDVADRDDEYGDLPYNPVYDEHGKLWVGSPIA